MTNTDDEITHHRFLNAYLVSKGAAPAKSQSISHSDGQHRDRGQSQPGRETAHKPDPANAGIPAGGPAIATTRIIRTLIQTTSFRRQFRACILDSIRPFPGTDADTSHPKFLQAIANTAAFHFRPLNKVETASIHRWRKGQAVLKCCAS
jgi:hypothetical protein